MTKTNEVQRIGLTPYERDLLAGMVYVLVDSRTDNLFDHIIGIFDSPAKAIIATNTDSGLWHHYCEHYWMGGDGQWEIIPFILNDTVEWKKKEWKEARPRRDQDFYFAPRIVKPWAPPEVGNETEIGAEVLERIQHRVPDR